MLIDDAEILLSAGHGGAGKVSFYPGETSGPDGGNGGRGGDAYIQAVNDLTALRQFTTFKKLSAENGQAGMSNRKFGKDGEDKIIKVPVGTSVIDSETGEEIELREVGQKVLICKGGLGGRGNFEFKSSRVTTPMFAQPGLPGVEKRIRLLLKLIADFGLIGLPNAGKSSLLNELTDANAKVGAYPFTTLEPNLGVMDGRVLADIPGLIEGASEGKGLGVKFLKHIEKVTVLVHCIPADAEDPIEAYKTIHNELKGYNENMLKKSEIIVITKTDLVTEKELKKLQTALKKTKKEIILASIHNFEQIEHLKKTLISMYHKSNGPKESI